MDELKHINTICNVEFYFEYKKKTYLREQIHGTATDNHTNTWYEVTKSKNWKLIEDNELVNTLEKLYIAWIK